MLIGIIGSTTFHKYKLTKELLYQIKQQYADTATIVTGGNLDGIEAHTKEICREFKLPYKEFNPSFTGWNPDSYFEIEYYGKHYHFSHLYDRYKKLVIKCDVLFVGIDSDKDEKFYNNFIKIATKRGINVIRL